MEEIKRMQKYLLLIRRAVGWTAEEFGEQIGVTRQTINNIESGRTNLTKTQYIAMRSVLSAEINKNPKDTTMLADILEVFVDNPDDYTPDTRKVLLRKANILAPSVINHTLTKKEIVSEWRDIILGLALIGIGAYSIASSKPSDSWLIKMLSRNKD
ncbi:MAG: helix-turn-helix transcriptional regulator [Ruminococcus sp.]|nr:helix-turn-helix transcriptional regulator [Ruminococcus sp.]